MNRLRIIYILVIFSFSAKLFAQTDSSQVDKADRFSKNSVGFMSIGFKNTYGGWGVFYLRRIPLGKAISRFRIGCGIKESFVIGGGFDFRLYTNHKRFELFYSLDYSYNRPGEYRNGSDRIPNYPTDLYNLSECQYLHTYISSHYLFRNSNASLQLKTGYAFLLNKVNVTHSSGPDTHYATAKRLTDGGFMIGLDFIVFFNRKDLARKNK